MICQGLKVIDCGSFIAAPAAATRAGRLRRRCHQDRAAGRRRRLPHGAKAARHAELRAAVRLAARQPQQARPRARPAPSARGRRCCTGWSRGADVFITNYPLAVRKKLAIDHDRLAALNPRLIYASFTGYGETGAEAAKPGFDVTAYWARSGLMDMVRSDASTPPARALAGMGDHPSGVSLFAAIVAGAVRARTHRARQDASARRCWPTASGPTASWRRPRCAAPPSRRGRRARSSSTRWAATTAAATAAGCCWRSSTSSATGRRSPSASGRGDLVDDPRYAKQADRFARSAELIAQFDLAFEERDRDDWRQVFDAAGIVFECVAEVERPRGRPADARCRRAGPVRERIGADHLQPVLRRRR